MKDETAVREPKQRRWRFQFSLRTLLIAVAMLSICVWRIATVKRQAERQKAAAARIHELGGTAQYDIERFSVGIANAKRPWWDQMLGIDFFHNIEVVDLSTTKLSNDDLKSIALGCPAIIALDLHGTEITSDGLACLVGLRNLEVLDISNTPANDDGMCYIAELINLRALNLCNPWTAGESNGEFSRLRSSMFVNPTWDVVSRNSFNALYVLYGGRPEISDHGVELLQHLPKLEVLDLEGAGISSHSAAFVAMLPSLKNLTIRATHGVGRTAWLLRQSRPELKLEIESADVKYLAP